MSDFRATCPEGHRITSVVQLIVAHAEIEDFNRHKLPIYTGSTEVLYDTQESFAETGSDVRFEFDGTKMIEMEARVSWVTSR